MNKTEARYAAHLEARRVAGEIEAYWFEGMTFKLAADTRYTPDFMVMESGGLIRFDEVKGFFEDDAKVKIKVAAAMFPFAFRVVKALAQKDGGGFEFREVKV